MSDEIYCETCGKRVNGVNAIHFKRGLCYYCKEHFRDIVPEPQDDAVKCLYCKHFKYQRDDWGNLKGFWLMDDTYAIFATCTKHDKTVSTLTYSCNDFVNNFQCEPFCSEENIIRDAVNNWCAREEKNYDCPSCSIKSFWDEVILEKDHHFVNGKGDVLSYTKGEGGFYNDRFNIYFEDGSVLEDMGLWFRGKCPNDHVRDCFRKARVELIR